VSASERRAAIAWGQPLGRRPDDRIRAELAGFLRQLADDIEADEILCQPYAIAVSVVGQYSADVGLTGFKLWDEVLLAEKALESKVREIRWGSRPRNVVEEEILTRVAVRQARRRHEAAFPEKCPKCSQRFRTKRGLAMHIARSRMEGHGGDRR